MLATLGWLALRKTQATAWRQSPADELRKKCSIQKRGSCLQIFARNYSPLLQVQFEERLTPTTMIEYGVHPLGKFHESLDSTPTEYTCRGNEEW
jgi:hypothetical protein